MGNKLFISSFVLLIINLSVVLALGDMDIALGVTSQVSLSYTGSSGSASGSVRNDNWYCDIECTYSTDQGSSGGIGGIITAGETRSFTYTVYAQGTSPKQVKVTVSCSAPGTGSALCISTPSPGSAIGYTSVYFGRCGDGTCNSGYETKCSCQSDCGSCSGAVSGTCNEYYCSGSTCTTRSRCSSYERCESGVCKTYCGNNQCNSDETKCSCPSDCGSCSGNAPGTCQEYYCSGSTCATRNKLNCCGNGQCESGESCSSCPKDCGVCCGNGQCDYGETCSSCSQDCGSCCGNGKKDSGETCSSCPQDIQCPSNQQCEADQCKTYCGNGQCDGSETCLSCSNDCGACCPNGKCDENLGENCGSCAQDCPCRPNQGCSGSVCVNLGTRENCGSIGEVCKGFCENMRCVDCRTDSDCKSSESYTGKSECSTDNRGRYRIIAITGGKCTSSTCTGSDEKKGPFESCGDKFCQDGECGCKEGYSACFASGKCEQEKSLEDGTPCSCPFQCKSGFCDKSGKCITAINILFTVKDEILKLGETTKADISADNTLQQVVYTQMTLNLDGGLLSGSIGGEDCSGNQCKGNENIPEGARTSINVDISADKVGKIKLTSTITSTIDGQPYISKSTKFITVIDPKDGKCTEGEDSTNACKDCRCPKSSFFKTYTCQENNACKEKKGYGVYLIGVLVFVVLFGLYLVVSRRNVVEKVTPKEKNVPAKKRNIFLEKDMIPLVEGYLKKGYTFKQIKDQLLLENWPKPLINKILKDAYKDIKTKKAKG